MDHVRVIAIKNRIEVTFFCNIRAGRRIRFRDPAVISAKLLVIEAGVIPGKDR